MLHWWISHERSRRDKLQENKLAYPFLEPVFFLFIFMQKISWLRGIPLDILRDIWYSLRTLWGLAQVVRDWSAKPLCIGSIPIDPSSKWKMFSFWASFFLPYGPFEQSWGSITYRASWNLFRMPAFAFRRFYAHLGAFFWILVNCVCVPGRAWCLHWGE